MAILSVNGKSFDVEAEADTPLLWVLRENLGLTGTKYGCGIAQCGACTVHIDGAPVRSCSVQLGDAIGKKITTIEGLAQNGVLHRVQKAWIEHDVPQCGYCQSGMIIPKSAMDFWTTRSCGVDGDFQPRFVSRGGRRRVGGPRDSDFVHRLWLWRDVFCATSRSAASLT